MANRLGSAVAERTRVGSSQTSESVPVLESSDNSRIACGNALDIVASLRCVCRASTGRHHLLKTLLEMLHKAERANWLDVLSKAQESAATYNREAGLPAGQPPAGVVYNQQP